MPHKDYGHRDVLDKLGIKPGYAVCVVEAAWPLDNAFLARVAERTGRPASALGEPVDVALITVDESSDTVALLTTWRERIDDAGGIWLLTRKRGQPGYLDQRLLIDAGKDAGVVDNKVCAVSDTVSAMRFVIRKADRASRVADQQYELGN